MVQTARAQAPPRRPKTADPVGVGETIMTADILSAMEDRRQAAISTSLLVQFPTAAQAQLLAHAVSFELPAGGILYRNRDEPRCALVISGLVRAFLAAPDGRTVTIRYVRPGELIGIPLIVGGPIPANMEMVTNGELLVLNARYLRHLGQTEPAVGWLLAQELARRLTETYQAVADNTFGSLRERVARHLLDLSAVRQDQRLVADVTQQTLAEAVGSTRPAVARVLGELRRGGLILTGTRDIQILNPEGLHAETWSGHLSLM